ncbi:hypothetical protein N7516_003336 [Penicillium verrucosum]|uniref:uncharacterized protein n=1 Tax=Penicillium verrucosum TaxID=60171 RepID=UPI002544E571|nr:uncharacterized protein N7516_003336 [Penicillium verrucosum]KAJ5943168.1 hypothetical protein N7516_003336 [Penicillium verrucosum]
MTPPKFTPPVTIRLTPTHCLKRQDTIFDELFQSIDKCIFLSSTQDALDSLLCSAFFDPSVPCNLVGAASLGARKAISTANVIDNQQLLNTITHMKPHLSILWTAAICNDQANSLLNMVLNSLPPICLVAAFLTHTIHSFLQVEYCLRDLEEPRIARATEFQTSYFCRPDVSVPWSPAPPFGATPIQNLSLEVRAHITHQHKPISWRINWVLDSGERIPASKVYQPLVAQIYDICDSCPADQADERPYLERDLADEQSGVATSRLFNWHRSYDDGIWLDEGSEDVELVRELQKHPWIVDPFDSLENEPVEETKHRKVCFEAISRWNSEVERFRLLGENASP